MQQPLLMEVTMKLATALLVLATGIGLAGCGPKAPDQALQLSGSIQGQDVIGLVMPETGQVSVMIGGQACEGVLSDFTDDPRTGVLLCPSGSNSVSYHLTAKMENSNTGHLMLRKSGEQQSVTIDISSAFGQPQPK